MALLPAEMGQMSRLLALLDQDLGHAWCLRLRWYLDWSNRTDSKSTIGCDLADRRSRRKSPTGCRPAAEAQQAGSFAPAQDPVPGPVVFSPRRSILAAMMKSFSCRPLIFLVLNETVA